jgi:hypothetical protein
VVPLEQYGGVLTEIFSRSYERYSKYLNYLHVLKEKEVKEIKINF